MTNLTKILTAATGVASLAVAATFIPTATAGEGCSSCSGDKVAGTQTVAYEGDTQDIVATAIGAGQFNTLATALTEAGLVETLQGDGPFTVFAPTDDAFAALPEGALDGLLADKEKLTKVLTYHVIGGQKVMAEQVIGMDGESVETIEGSEIDISVVDGNVKLNDDVTVTATDVDASNGVIHVIDGVLMP